MKNLLKVGLFVLAIFSCANVSPYTLHVVNESSEPIYVSYTTRLSRCGGGDVFPDPTKPALKKQPLKHGKSFSVDLGKEYGSSCYTWCITGLNIYTQLKDSHHVLKGIQKVPNVEGKKSLLGKSLPTFDFAIGKNIATGVCRDISIIIKRDSFNGWYLDTEKNGRNVIFDPTEYSL